MSDMFDDSEFDVSGFNLEGDVLCLKQTYRTVSFVILGHQDNLSRQITSQINNVGHFSQDKDTR